MDPNFYLAQYVLGDQYVAKGQWQEGIAAYQRARQLENKPWVIAGLGYAYAVAGRRSEAQKVLAELKELSKQKHVSSFWLATIYAGLGKKDRALELLENSYQERSLFMAWLKMEPKLDPLRSDPRFQDLLRRMNFPE